MLPRRGSNIEDMKNEDARIVNNHSIAMKDDMINDLESVIVVSYFDFRKPKSRLELR